jgi:hypothetical protein
MPGRWLLLNYKWSAEASAGRGAQGLRVQFPVGPAGGPEARAGGRSGLVLTCKWPAGEGSM